MRREVTGPGPKPDQQRLACGHDIATSGVSDGGATCDPCGLRLLPTSVRPGRRTPTFTTATVPAGLLRDHLTTAWARLEVERGSVAFIEDEPPWRATATNEQPVTIVPDRTHRIEPSADARFAVQFFDHVDGGS